MDEQNPYAPPVSDVVPMEAPAGPAGFLAGGRAVDAGRGFQWIADGFDIFKKSPWIWILLLVVYTVFEILIGQIPYGGQFIGYLLSPVFSAGFMIGCQALADDRPLEFGVLFAGFGRHAGRLFTLGAIYVGCLGAITGIVIAIAGGGALAMVAAVGKGAQIDPAVLGVIFAAAMAALLLMIPVAMAFYYAPALVALNDLGVGDAIKASFSAAAKNVLPFIVYTVMGFLWAILAAIPCGLGFLVLLPTLTASLYTSYRDVFYEPELG